MFDKYRQRIRNSHAQCGPAQGEYQVMRRKLIDSSLRGELTNDVPGNFLGHVFAPAPPGSLQVRPRRVNSKNSKVIRRTLRRRVPAGRYRLDSRSVPSATTKLRTLSPYASCPDPPPEKSMCAYAARSFPKRRRAVPGDQTAAARSSTASVTLKMATSAPIATARRQYRCSRESWLPAQYCQLYRASCHKLSSAIPPF